MQICTDLTLPSSFVKTKYAYVFTRKKKNCSFYIYLYLNVLFQRKSRTEVKSNSSFVFTKLTLIVSRIILKTTAVCNFSAECKCTAIQVVNEIIEKKIKFQEKINIPYFLLDEKSKHTVRFWGFFVVFFIPSTTASTN